MTGQDGFVSKEVSWLLDNVPMYGTLTKPEGQGPFPGVVLVAGSGPTDRDWCSPLLPGTNGRARLLSDALTKAGFMTLRYDKRASGSQVKENFSKLAGKISMQGHVDELSGAIGVLTSEAGFQANHLFVLTNSEGAIHALNYQLQATLNRFKGLVLTGAPGRSIGQVGRTQILAQLGTMSNGDLLMQYYDEAIAAFVAGKPVVPNAALPEPVQNMLLALSNPFNLPFVRELWLYNPAEYIAKILEPILVVIGKKDIQVDWKADGGALESAMVNHRNVSFVYPENADHVLKREDTPREELTAQAALSYNSLDRHLDEEALDAIISWLTDQNSKLSNNTAYRHSTLFE